MVKLLHMLSVLSFAAAGGVVTLCGNQWLSSVDDSRPSIPQDRRIYGCPVANCPDVPQEQSVSPLIAAAQEFASYLNPPKSDVKSLAGEPVAVPVQPVATVRPLVPAVRFRLYGTSCCPSQPGRSMALIGEAGASQGSERWVKEGSEVGHFIIHEIRQDGVVYRDGDQLREMAVETAGSSGSIVQDTRPGSRKIIAAVEDVSRTLPVPTGPNNVGISGN